MRTILIGQHDTNRLFMDALKQAQYGGTSSEAWFPISIAPSLEEGLAMARAGIMQVAQ